MNFTNAGDERNAENLLVIRGNRELVFRYESNFAEHLVHGVKYEDSAVD